tara:strand:- start:570509 stop:571756 length:1248 start_codon:yes stop_codon:yes gene_type:complete
MRINPRSVVLFALSIVLAVSAGYMADTCADTVELSGGGHVAGKVLRRSTSGKVPHVIVKVDDGITLALPESRVRRVVTGDQLAEYRRLAAEAGDDPQKHYELARWCVANELPLQGQKRYHYQRAIALDPDHALARAALDYVKDGNDWILYSDQQRKRGMIRDGGKWKLPEAVAIEQYQDETNEKAKRWIKDITRLRAMALNPNVKPEKAQEAFQELAAIDDPLAAAAIARELGNKQPRRMRMLYIQLLGKFRNAISVKALTLVGYNDADDVVREAALTHLQQYGAPSAVDYYRQKLKSNSPREVKDALRALEFFPNPELALTYIDALVTEHRIESASGPGINAGFGGPTNSSGGAGSFSTGNKKETIVTYKRNATALSLLKLIEPGADFGYDKQAWREYFADKLTTYRGDLRREP